MGVKLMPLNKRCGTVRGVLSNSKEVIVSDLENRPIRTFGSVREMELKSEKYFGIPITAMKIRLHCKNEKPFDAKYYFKLKHNYIF